MLKERTYQNLFDEEVFEQVMHLKDSKKIYEKEKYFKNTEGHQSNF